MAIEFDCSRCGKPLFAQDQFAGRGIKCPGCGADQTIPSPAGQAPPEPQAQQPQPRRFAVPPGALHTGTILDTTMTALRRHWLLAVCLNLLALGALLAVAVAVLLFTGLSAVQPAAGQNPYLNSGFVAYNLAMWLASSLLVPGLLQAGIKMADQALGIPAQPGFADLLAGFEQPLKVLGVWLPPLVAGTLVNFCGFALQPLVPGALGALISLAMLASVVAIQVFFYVRFFFALPLVLEKRLPVLEAFAQSWELTRARGSVILFVQLLAFFALIPGLLCCGIGVVVTGTFSVCLLGALYRSLLTAQR